MDFGRTNIVTFGREQNRHLGAEQPVSFDNIKHWVGSVGMTIARRLW